MDGQLVMFSFFKLDYEGFLVHLLHDIAPRLQVSGPPPLNRDALVMWVDMEVGRDWLKGTIPKAVAASALFIIVGVNISDGPTGP